MRRALVVGIALLGCASPRIQGANVLTQEQQAMGKVIAHYAAASCVDAQRAPLTVAREVTLLEREDGKRFVLSRQGSDDGLAVENQHTIGAEVAYQATIAPAGGAAILHDYRFPSGGGRPHFVLTDVFNLRDTPTGFVASPGRPSVSCWLDRVDGEARDVGAEGADAGEAREPEPPELDDAGGGS